MLTDRDGRRGQSSVIALVVILTLALASSLLIATVGTLTLDSSQQHAETENAVRTMTELDSKASLVALEGADAATMRIGKGGGGQVAVDEGAGELQLVLARPDGTREELISGQELGAVTYRNGNERVAYQGGGVWRRTTGANGSVMVSPPEVHYREGTLTLPMIRVRGTEYGLSGAAIRKVDTRSVYPPDAGEGNPVPAGSELEMNITSEYYQAWGAYFERRIGGNVTYDHDADTVRVLLRSPVSPFSVDSGLISVGTSDRMEMSGSGNSPTFVDAYNSSNSTYDPDDPENATVRGKGGLKMGGNTYINGTVDTGGSIFFSGSDNTIDGNAAYQGEIQNLDKSGNTVTGWTAENGSGVEVPPIDGAVNDKVNSICDGSADSLSNSGTYGAGEYCRDGDLSIAKGETLAFDLSNGNVTVAVDGNVDVKGNIRVTGTDGSNHVVKLWLAGDEVTISGNNDETEGQVTVEQQRTPALKLYGASTTFVTMKAHSTFQGLIYAPSTEGAGGGIRMKSDSELYGSAVVGTVEMNAGSSVHYDKALGGYQFQHGGNAPAQSLSYLHVTINDVEVGEK